MQHAGNQRCPNVGSNPLVSEDLCANETKQGFAVPSLDDFMHSFKWSLYRNNNFLMVFLQCEAGLQSETIGSGGDLARAPDVGQLVHALPQ